MRQLPASNWSELYRIAENLSELHRIRANCSQPQQAVPAFAACETAAALSYRTLARNFSNLGKTDTKSDIYR